MPHNGGQAFFSPLVTSMRANKLVSLCGRGTHLTEQEVPLLRGQAGGVAPSVGRVCASLFLSEIPGGDQVIDSPVFHTDLCQVLSVTDLFRGWRAKQQAKGGGEV